MSGYVYHMLDKVHHLLVWGTVVEGSMNMSEKTSDDALCGILTDPGFSTTQLVARHFAHHGACSGSLATDLSPKEAPVFIRAAYHASCTSIQFVSFPAGMTGWRSG